MHARHVLAGSLALGLGALLVPACAGTVDSPTSLDAITDDVEALDYDGPIDITARFVCKGLDVVECMIRCADQGTPCRAQREHPHNASAGKGNLYACRTSIPRSCDYLYTNGDRCFFFQAPPFARCLHQGGR